MSTTKTKRQINIAVKFNLLTILIILVTSGGISFFLIQNATSHIYRNLINHGSIIAGMASQTSEYSIYTGDKESMTQIIESVEVDEDIAYVCLLDKDKKPLMCKSFISGLEIPPAPVMSMTNSSFPPKTTYEELVNKEDGKRYISFLSPIVGFAGNKTKEILLSDKENANQEIIGYVYLGLSLGNLHKRINEFQVSTLAFTSLFIFIGVMLTLFLTKRITAPIKKLSLATKSISEGILDQYVHVQTNDEISDLAGTFNHMIGRLQAYRRDIESHNEELLRTNTQLLQEINYRKRIENSLEERTVELMRSNKDLEQFAYVVSHDLQEPLRKVLVFGDRLITKHGKTLNNEGRDYIERMKNASIRMQTLIKNLLAYSKITTNARPFSRVDLATTIRNVVSDLEIQIEKTKGCVSFGNLPVIDADPLQMYQLFQNLIGNALKYHRKDVHPIVDIQAQYLNGIKQDRNLTSHGNGFCQITVTDNGIGFNEKYAEFIFGMFQRLHRRDEYEGTGVGLSICRKIVERHSGSITAKSTPGEGAKFIIVLPIHQGKRKDDE